MEISRVMGLLLAIWIFVACVTIGIMEARIGILETKVEALEAQRTELLQGYRDMNETQLNILEIMETQEVR